MASDEVGANLIDRGLTNFARFVSRGDVWELQGQTAFRGRVGRPALRSCNPWRSGLIHTHRDARSSSDHNLQGRRSNQDDAPRSGGRDPLCSRRPSRPVGQAVCLEWFLRPADRALRLRRFTLCDKCVHHPRHFQYHRRFRPNRLLRSPFSRHPTHGGFGDSAWQISNRRGAHQGGLAEFRRPWFPGEARRPDTNPSEATGETPPGESDCPRPFYFIRGRGRSGPWAN